MKRQLEQQGIDYQALDNGILSCAHPKRLQALCDGLSAAKIEALLRKWLRLLPHPFSARDRQAGYRYDLSILQIELSRTQAWIGLCSGRIFFEEVIRENLDIGRPKQVQLIFDRWVTKATPGLFRTRVITDGVAPSLHVDYKGTRIKQYHKEGRALRTETTINNTRDFDIGKRLLNLPDYGGSGSKPTGDSSKSRKSATIVCWPKRPSNNCIAPAKWTSSAPRRCASLIPRSNPCAMPCWCSRNSQEASPTATCATALPPYWAKPPTALTAGQMTYHLRRLRLHQIIERISGTHRYRLTDFGLRTALFFTRIYNRLLRPGLGRILPDFSKLSCPLRRAFDKLDHEVTTWAQQAQLQLVENLTHLHRIFDFKISRAGRASSQHTK